jgi:hypothetical protein
MQARLALHIDRLRLSGFSPLEAQRVREAFTTTLATAKPGDLARPATHERLRLSLPSGAGSSPEALGRAAALALLEGWRR